MNLRPSKFTMRLVHQGILACIGCVALFSSVQALASQVGVVSTIPEPAVSAGVIAWGSVTALACTFLMNLTADGTPTPWNWNPQVRWLLALAASTVSGLVHGLQSGVSTQTAIVTAVGALLAATLAHFSTPGALAKKGTVGLLVLALGTGGLTGCATLFPGLQTGTTTADITAFITVAETVDSFAATAWADAQPFIPQASLASAQAAWARAQDAYQAAISLAQDSLAAYTAGAAQNWAGVIAAVTSAVDAVVTVINQFGGSIPGTVGANHEFAVHVATTHAAQASLHKFRAP